MSFRKFSNVTLFFLFVLTQPGLTKNIKAPTLTLQDQHKNQHAIRFPSEQVTVLAFADKAGSEQLEGWIQPLYQRYEQSISIYGVANMKGLPRPMRGLLRSIFRKKLDYPVMMDWTGDASSSYHYQARQANVFLVNREGRIKHRYDGAATSEALAVFFGHIDALLGKPATHAIPPAPGQSGPPATVPPPVQ